MNKKEYNEKIWKYWHGHLPEKKRQELWDEIDTERDRRRAMASLYAKVVAVVIIVSFIVLGYFLLW